MSDADPTAEPTEASPWAPSASARPDPPDEPQAETSSDAPSALVPPPDAPPPAPTPAPSSGDGGHRLARAAGAAVVTALAAAVVLVAVIQALRGDDDPAVDPGDVGALVPSISIPSTALEPTEQAPALRAAMAAPGHDVAVPGPVPMVCAAVVLDAPMELTGHWERDGQEVAATAPTTVGPPGFGSCIGDAADGLPEGVYQFFVRDRAANASAPGTIVIGAVQVDQVFVNDSDDAICTIRIAPRRAGYFDAYELRAPVEPGTRFTLAVADVDQEAVVSSCGEDPETVAEISFGPDPAVPRSLS